MCRSKTKVARGTPQEHLQAGNLLCLTCGPCGNDLKIITKKTHLMTNNKDLNQTVPRQMILV